MKKDILNKVLPFIVGVGVGIVIMACMWPSRITKLANGEEVVATFADKQITANDLYKELSSDQTGLQALLNLVDLGILKEKYTNEKEKVEYAESKVLYYLDVYKNQGYTEEEALSEMHATSRDDLVLYFQKQYYFQQYYNDCFKEEISEKELKNYYNKEMFGTRAIDVYSLPSDKATVENIKKMLENNKTSDDILAKYPEVIYNQIDEFNSELASEYSSTFVSNVKTHTRGQVSKVFQDDLYGYTVIYIRDSKDKASYEDSISDIIAELSLELVEKDPNLYDKFLVKLREKNNLSIIDTDILADYKKVKGSLK